MLATGRFDTKSTPHAPHSDADGVVLARISIAKTFEGDLVGTGAVEMIAARPPTQGSAGYVAIERVDAVLDGRTGTFVLQHSGTMDRGTPSLSVTVVPDTGTGELAGIRGSMQIDVSTGDHRYTFEYELPA